MCGSHRRSVRGQRRRGADRFRCGHRHRLDPATLVAELGTLSLGVRRGNRRVPASRHGARRLLRPGYLSGRRRRTVAQTRHRTLAAARPGRSAERGGAVAGHLRGDCLSCRARRPASQPGRHDPGRRPDPRGARAGHWGAAPYAAGSQPTARHLL
ncbi:hypothetical protein ED236_08315 [Pseudomethylobacillus aquaticus]|uniref:Uncharacterized protein n=1 Tax=Pseudomethylobacillus aquaticus TaxID=2676064 RepID=A0A3N0UYV3_9PROT|nr:hypothetical protein ED236_08315 [Pseudomethylobacillus aquaticus]